MTHIDLFCLRCSRQFTAEPTGKAIPQLCHGCATAQMAQAKSWFRHLSEQEAEYRARLRGELAVSL